MKKGYIKGNLRKENSFPVVMSKRRTSTDQLFQEPLKVQCVNVVKTSKKVHPVSMENKQTSESSVSMSCSSNELEGSAGENAYFKMIDDALEKFFEEVQREGRLVLETSYPLAASLNCAVGLSVARDLLPVVKLESPNVFSDRYGRTISFTEHDWERFLFNLDTVVKQFFLEESQDMLSATFNDYNITSSSFLNEKIIKLQWNNKATVYLTKEQVFHLIDLADVLGKRLKMLDQMPLSYAYYDTLALVNDILDPYEKKRVETVPKELIMKLVRNGEKSLELLFSEMIIYYPERIVRDINQMRCIY